MAVTNVRYTGSGRSQFRGVFDCVAEMQADYNPPSVNSKGFQSETVPLPGVRMGDICLCSFDADVDDMTLTAHVHSTGVVDVHMNNNTSGAIDLSEGQIYIVALRPVNAT